MRLHLEIWRQSEPRDGGRFVSYEMDEAVPDMSFLELLDVLNERLERAGEEPVAFEHDCREGICGSCGFLINGRAHGPLRGGDRVPAPPAPLRGRRTRRAGAVAGARVSGAQGPGGGPLRLRPRDRRRRLHLGQHRQRARGQLPAGAARRRRPGHGRRRLHRLRRLRRLLQERRRDAVRRRQGDAARPAAAGAPRSAAAAPPPWWRRWTRRASGNCTNERECEGDCPKEISFANIARLNREFLAAKLTR